MAVVKNSRRWKLDKANIYNDHWKSMEKRISVIMAPSPEALPENLKRIIRIPCDPHKHPSNVAINATRPRPFGVPNWGENWKPSKSKRDCIFPSPTLMNSSRSISWSSEGIVVFTVRLWRAEKNMKSVHDEWRTANIISLEFAKPSPAREWVLGYEPLTQKPSTFLIFDFRLWLPEFFFHRSQRMNCSFFGVSCHDRDE